MKIDIGCGKVRKPGFVGLDIKNHGQEYVVDITKEPLPIGDGQTMRVECENMLEHLDCEMWHVDGKPEIEKSLKEFYRIMAPEATLMVRVPSPQHADALKEDHKSVLTWKQWKKLFENAHFKVKKIKTNGTWVSSRFFSKICVLLAKIDPFFGAEYIFILVKA